MDLFLLEALDFLQKLSVSDISLDKFRNFIVLLTFCITPVELIIK